MTGSKSLNTTNQVDLPELAAPKAATFGLAALTFLFFAWGFLTSLNDVLVPHLRSAFTLTYTEGAFVQGAFFLSYFVCSLPSSAVVSRFGYRRGLAIGLLIMALGAALFIPSAITASYPLFLVALFVLGSGITLLQVTANPYVTLLGSRQTASSRLNLTQAFNSLGTTIAPWIGGSLILSSAAASDGTTANVAADVAAVKGPYLGLAFILLALAVGFFVFKLPEPKDAVAKLSWNAVKRSFAVPSLALGVVGIFLYVGAEVTIGSFLINFIGNAVHVTSQVAARYVSLYWGGAMVGRFIGSSAMRYISPNKILAGACVTAVALLGLTQVTEGYVAVVAIIAVGLCNSIMFPTIFTLGLSELGNLVSVGSSLMSMAIVGGAVLPLAIGQVADRIGLERALALPAVCYAFIAFYGLYTKKHPAGAPQPA